MFVNSKLANTPFPRERLYMPDADLEFVFDHLSKCRGPTHSNYAFNVLKTYRFQKMPMTQRFPKNSQYQLLMHGANDEIVADILKYGFNNLSTKKSVFGAQYYFTSCSTKAANYSCPNAWLYERHADKGVKQPESGYIGYILYCVVATGKTVQVDSRQKRSNERIYKKYGSMMFRGVYEPIQEEWIQVNGVKAKLLSGPFRRSDIELPKHVNDTFFYDEICVNDSSKVFPLILAEVEYE